MLGRGVNIILAIGVSVVVAMMGRPPQRALLICHATHERQDKLKDAVCFIRAMREVAMVAGGDGKDTDTIECDTRGNGNPANTGPEEKQTARVQNDKLCYRTVVQFVCS